ncbi:MAG: alpha/beta hydrolase [Nitratireductor sp.]|nr:alpha/beta hydrolase [Nitratireductor sp.]
MDTGISRQKIHFPADGLKLCGHLYKPGNFDEGGKYPAIICQGSAFSVKEQMSGTYAGKMAENGFIALAFDYRTYGESEGAPRQYENPEAKRNDLEAAVSYLLSLPYVTSVSALGVCASGGNVAHLAATDKRLGSVAFVAGMVGGPAELAAERNTSDEEVAALMSTIRAAKQHYEQTGEAQRLTAYSSTDPTAFYFGDVDYYENPKRGNVQEFLNEYAIIGLETLLPFDPMSKAGDITIPAIVLHSDNCIASAASRKFYDNLGGEKELVWGTEAHFDYYDKPALIDEVTTNVARFIKGHTDASLS